MCKQALPTHFPTYQVFDQAFDLVPTWCLLESLPVTAVGGTDVRNHAQILKHLHVALDGTGIFPESDG